MGLRGISGRPFIDLSPHLDLTPLGAIHDEVCLALSRLPVDYTGGSHRAMGIVPTSRASECYVDYLEAIAAMTDAEYATLRSLADRPDLFDQEAREKLEFGEERKVPLNRTQMLWLKYRFGVYFPWKVFVELIPNGYWGEKSSGVGKAFTRQARAFFPKTVAFIERLPFTQRGRATVMGLEGNDHGTVHHDGDPAHPTPPDHFITFCPAGNKRLFLWDEATNHKLPIASPAYWFNDQDDHGVDADPFFRYSIRVDGEFSPEFLERVLTTSPP